MFFVYWVLFAQIFEDYDSISSKWLELYYAQIFLFNFFFFFLDFIISYIILSANYSMLIFSVGFLYTQLSEDQHVENWCSWPCVTYSLIFFFLYFLDFRISYTISLANCGSKKPWMGICLRSYKSKWISNSCIVQVVC